MTKLAKIFVNGRSQAVRLPQEFRFTGTQVRVTRQGRGVSVGAGVAQRGRLVRGARSLQYGTVSRESQPAGGSACVMTSRD